MIPGFAALVEERIKKAQEKGEFDNLPGKNKPLKFEDQNVPEELRLAHKILKNSGFLPPEIELKKQINSTEELIGNINYDSPERQRLQKKLNYLIVKLNSIKGDRPGVALNTEVYRDNLLKKMS